MSAIQEFAATSGPGGMLGGLAGWAIFEAKAVEVRCAIQGMQPCTEAFGMAGPEFLLYMSGIGGLLGFAVMIYRQERDAG